MQNEAARQKNSSCDKHSATHVSSITTPLSNLYLPCWRYTATKFDLPQRRISLYAWALAETRHRGRTLRVHLVVFRDRIPNSQFDVRTAATLPAFDSYQET